MNSDEALKTIRDAKMEGTKLFLIGVKHGCLDVRRFQELRGIIEEIRPSLVLLEGKTPESDYRNGNATGDFMDEIKRPEFYWQIPNLWSIREVVDRIGSLVAGFDMSHKDKRELESKNELTKSRIKRIHDSIFKKAERNLDNAESLSVEEYKSFERIQDRLGNINENYDTPGINGIFGAYFQVTEILGQNNSVSHILKKELERLEKIKASLDNYLLTRESFMAKEILKRHFDGDNTSVVLVGRAHIQGNSYLIEEIKKQVEIMRILTYE